MYNKNNKGPNTEPCGTPQELTSVLEIYGPTCAVCRLFLRYEQIQLLAISYTSFTIVFQSVLQQ